MRTVAHLIPAKIARAESQAVTNAPFAWQSFALTPDPGELPKILAGRLKHPDPMDRYRSSFKFSIVQHSPCAPASFEFRSRNG